MDEKLKVAINLLTHPLLPLFSALIETGHFSKRAKRDSQPLYYQIIIPILDETECFCGRYWLVVGS